MKVIGLAGPIGCGKTTVANYIQEQYGYKPVAFAAPLKAAVAAIFGCSVGELDNQEFKASQLPGDLGKTYRHALQTLGTEWGRNCIHPDIWLKLLEQNVLNSSQPVVITDVRFPNEAELVRKLGTLIHIESPVTRDLSHASEVPIPKSDGDVTLINNHEGLVELYNSIELLRVQEII